MAVDDMDAVGGSLELEKKRIANPWVILAAVVFVVAFVLGWRSVVKTRKQSDPGPGQPS